MEAASASGGAVVADSAVPEPQRGDGEGDGDHGEERDEVAVGGGAEDGGGRAKGGEAEGDDPTEDDADEAVVEYRGDSVRKR